MKIKTQLFQRKCPESDANSIFGLLHCFISFQMTRRAYFLCSIRVIRGQGEASQNNKKVRRFG